MWPILLDTSKDDCMKILRRFELEAYGALVTALRAQGSLTSEKLKLLKDAATALYIPPERHRAEVRRAVNDEELTTIAQHVEGCNTYAEWSVEGRRKIRLVQREVPQTAFLDVARRIAEAASVDNARMPWPSATAQKPQNETNNTSNQMRYDIEERRKKRRRLIPEVSAPIPPKHRSQKHTMGRIQQVYKLQSRGNIQSDSAIMPPPQARPVQRTPQIKTTSPMMRRVPSSEGETSKTITEKSQSIPTQTVSSKSVKIAQITNSSTQSTQKLVIVSSSQNILQSSTSMSKSIMSNNLITEIKQEASENVNMDAFSTPIKQTAKSSSNQLIIPKSQLTPLQTVERPKMVTVRPQGSIILPLPTQAQTVTGTNLAGVSVPVLQGVQWKNIPGKHSTLKLLPFTGNAKILQKQGGLGSGPIYVMSKPSNIIMNKINNSDVTTTTPSTVTHIRQIKAEDIKPNVLIIRKSGASTTQTTVALNTISTISQNSTISSDMFKTITSSRSISAETSTSSNVLDEALRVSGVMQSDDDIESQISQYTEIPQISSEFVKECKPILDEDVAMHGDIEESSFDIKEKKIEVKEMEVEETKSRGEPSGFSSASNMLDMTKISPTLDIKGEDQNSSDHLSGIFSDAGDTNR